MVAMAKKKQCGDVINSDFRNSHYESQPKRRTEFYENGGMPDNRNAFYNVEDPRRSLEHADYRHLRIDRTSFASCPPEAVNGYFPGRPWSKPDTLGDE
jgi:hypothetical protein